jgi:hypothetical protein
MLQRLAPVHSNGASVYTWFGIYCNSERIRSIGKTLLRGDSFIVFTPIFGKKIIIQYFKARHQLFKNIYDLFHIFSSTSNGLHLFIPIKFARLEETVKPLLFGNLLNVE